LFIAVLRAWSSLTGFWTETGRASHPERFADSARRALSLVADGKVREGYPLTGLRDRQVSRNLNAAAMADRLHHPHRGGRR
jgi:hypothetical protein